jgi:REP element-mobilizing transposase RayT
MSQSLAKVYLHAVFSTKNRAPFLTDRSLRQETHAYLAGACRRIGVPSLIVGGVEDHVHISCYMSRTITMADFIAEIKRESSKWIKTKDDTLSDFHWQGGYGIFSISPSHVDDLRRYIENQEEHHRHESFQDEYRRLLKKYGIEYDERYVWD